MLDKYFNPAPTFYKWDKFWVGFVPAILTPLFGVVALFVITFFNSKYNHNESFTPHMFLNSLRSNTTFLRIATLCCMLNAFWFFFFVNKDYNNASRSVMLTTMILVIAILVKELF